MTIKSNHINNYCFNINKIWAKTNHSMIKFGKITKNSMLKLKKFNVDYEKCIVLLYRCL